MLVNTGSIEWINRTSIFVADQSTPLQPCQRVLNLVSYLDFLRLPKGAAAGLAAMREDRPPSLEVCLCGGGSCQHLAAVFVGDC